jgi:O-antigen ligase
MLMKIDLINRELVQRNKFYLAPSFLAIVIALLMGGAIGIFGPYALIIVLGSLIMTSIILLRKDELALMIVIAVQLIVDWYLGLHIVSQLIALVLLSIFFLARSRRYPWVEPRALWLWVLFLILPIPAVIQGEQKPWILAFYYPNIFFGALVMFWLGMLVARNELHLRTLFQALAVLGTLLAIHTIIQATTGIVVLDTSSYDTYRATYDFTLANSGNITRTGSFLTNPDWNGTFFAMMLFLPLGLFTEASSLPLKFLYLTEMLLMLIALLFTYSGGAWIGVSGGIATFIFLAGRNHYRILVPVLAVMIGVIAVNVLSTQVNLLIQHASSPGELLLRLGGWQTAINVIRAFPLTGIGLGFDNYYERAEPYRDPAQYRPLAHPHDSYLELGAMAGLPVLIVFLALLLFALWLAWRNWIQVDRGTRCLLCGGIATIVALSVNSFSINGWTLPPLAAIGWMVLGATASPLINKRKQSGEKETIMASSFA